MTERKLQSLIKEIYRGGPVPLKEAMKLLKPWPTVEPSKVIEELERSGFEVRQGKVRIRRTDTRGSKGRKR
jgi:hypothetical protein